ncbi:MAG: cation:proton antiporter, partial [Lentisphaeria bacterium]|nr:cation:proton antiporter [Lentisphaeria bacterium]
RMIVGILCGWGIGKVGSWLFNRAKLDYEGLYFVMGIALVLASYGLTEIVHGNGFMAAYCAGLTMGNVRYNYKKGQIRFNNGLAWLMQVAMFTVLGMLVTFNDLIAVPQSGLFNANWVRGLLLGAALMFVARPAAVFLCLIRSQFSLRERLFISWVGLRGAAPIVLATFPLAAALTGSAAHGETPVNLFNLVFCMVITSVIIQGRTLMPLARLLKLDQPLQDKKRMPLELEETDSMTKVMHEFEIDKSSPCVNKTLAEINFKGARVMLIRRAGEFIMPHGDTVVELNDGVLMMGEHKLLHELAQEYFPGNDFFEN